MPYPLPIPQCPAPLSCCRDDFYCLRLAAQNRNVTCDFSFAQLNKRAAIDVAAVASGSAPGTLFGTCPVSQPNPPTSPTSWPCGTQLPHPPRAFHVIALRCGNKYKWPNAIDMDGRGLAGQPLHSNKSGARCQFEMGFNLVKMPTLA